MNRFKNSWLYKTYNNMFFKWGVNIFDSRLKEYGGFNHFIAYNIFKGKYTYLAIYLSKWEVGISHEEDDSYYDGYHNAIFLGFILISYGT